MFVCNVADEKRPKVADNFSLLSTKTARKLLAIFQTLMRTTTAFNNVKKKLSARHFLCLRLCRHVSAMGPIVNQK